MESITGRCIKITHDFARPTVDVIVIARKLLAAVFAIFRDSLFPPLHSGEPNMNLYGDQPVFLRNSPDFHCR